MRRKTRDKMVKMNILKQMVHDIKSLLAQEGESEDSDAVQHHWPTAFPITSSSHWGNRPMTRHAAASTAVGTVIIQPAS